MFTKPYYFDSEEQVYVRYENMYRYLIEMSLLSVFCGNRKIKSAAVQNAKLFLGGAIITGVIFFFAGSEVYVGDSLDCYVGPALAPSPEGGVLLEEGGMSFLTLGTIIMFVQTWYDICFGGLLAVADDARYSSLGVLRSVIVVFSFLFPVGLVLLTLRTNVCLAIMWRMAWRANAVYEVQ